MYYRKLLPLFLLFLIAGNAMAADTISLSDTQVLLQLARRLAMDYGYLVSYEEAPVDPERETVTINYGGGKVGRLSASKPVTFQIPRGPSPDQSGAAGEDARGAILPLSKELIQPLVDAYNASGNPSRFAVSFDGTFAHIYAVSHNVGGKMEDFQPILSTKVTMPERTAPCYQMLNDLYGELKKMRNVNVAQSQISANSIFRHQCTIVGEDLTARDVLIQIAHEFGSGNAQGAPPVQPGQGGWYTWWLSYDTDTASYYLSMGGVPNKTKTAVAAPRAPVTPKDQLSAARPAQVPQSGTHEDGTGEFNAAASH